MPRVRIFLAMSDNADSGRSKEDEESSDKPEIEKADIALGKKMASERDHPLVKAAGNASKVGDQGPLYALSVAVLLVGGASRNRRLANSGIAMVAAVTAADLGKRVVKRLMRRTRPHVLLDDGHYQTQAGGSDRKQEQSFPSGHTACSVAAARALSRTYPRGGAAAGVAALAIGMSRIAKGAHWPLDVLGGAVIGLAAEAAASRFLSLTLRFRD
jgi:membrane-associated phospholipid phosphatase